jgi:hypothetical protein
MNSGIIRNALTSTLSLELEYREPSTFRETGTKSERPTELQPPGELFENEFAYLLPLFERRRSFSDERRKSIVRI